jgi:hypothetical protein
VTRRVWGIKGNPKSISIDAADLCVVFIALAVNYKLKGKKHYLMFDKHLLFNRIAPFEGLKCQLKWYIGLNSYDKANLLLKDSLIMIFSRHRCLKKYLSGYAIF